MTYERTKFLPWLWHYTTFFFSSDGAPPLQWWKYFVSTRRMWIAIKATEEMRDECADVFEWGILRSELYESAKQQVERRAQE